MPVRDDDLQFLFYETFALIFANRNRNALSQLVKIDHECDQTADHLGHGCGTLLLPGR
jgi:hypothetical protein